MLLAGVLSSYMLSMYNEIIAIAEKESYKVKLYNQNLELKVAERTMELEVQNNELKKVNSELDHFVYSVSHDLRAPLLSTLGLINISRQEKNEQEKARYLELMHKSIRKLDNFIIDIINLSKNARLELQSEAVDFEKLISSVLEEHSFAESSLKISFIVQVNQKNCFYTDVKRLTIVLNNLISNAVRYSNPYQDQCYVKIVVSTDKECARIEVADNGIGIAQEHIAKVFNMFYRASEHKSGSGLGLYIVKETLHKLKGTVHIDSTLEMGTTFIITIPSMLDTTNP
jgi:signal transduction histidine kinase